MKNVDVVEHLLKAGVRLVFHGDVHETNVASNTFKWPGLVVLGVGTFSATAEARGEATPMMYQVIELMPDDGPDGFAWARVHTRVRPKANGPWESGDIWPHPSGTGKIAHIDIDLKTGLRKSLSSA